MPRRRLFVSHSSKTPENRALLESICEALDPEGLGFHVLSDQGGELTPGTDWERRLNEWMAECHAAVVLLSEAALERSDWVRKEAAVLSWRREIEPDFTLIPVLLDGLAPERLDEGLFGTLRISKDQCIRCGDRASRADAAAIAASIRAGLGDPQAAAARTPFERLESVIAQTLRGQASADTLEDCWDRLDPGCRPGWHPGRGERFATALARHVIRNGRLALAELTKLLDCIQPRLARDSARSLLGYLASLWVPPQAAAGIPAARRATGPGPCAVALNGRYVAEYTGRRYLERTAPLSGRWKPVWVTGTTRKAIVEDIRAAFRSPAVRRRPEDLDRRIRRFPDPVLVLLPQPEEPRQLPVDRDLLAELGGEYPGWVFLVPTGVDLPEGIEQALGARPLLPALDPELEEEQLDAYEDALDFIDNRLHAGP